MEKPDSPFLDILTWQDIRDDVAHVNPVLAHLIDEINPGSKYWLIKASYPFGAKIMEKGMLQLPDQAGQRLPLQQQESVIREQLSYHEGQPLGLVLHHSVERFTPLCLERSERIVDNHLYQAGELVFLSRCFEPAITYQAAQLLEMTAGARSLLMLPPIGDKTYFHRMKRTFPQLKIAPQTLSEHFPTFTALTQHPAFSLPWQAEVLFFSALWIAAIKTNPAWLKLRLYLLEQVWQQSEYWRNKARIDCLFSQVQENQNLRPDPYLADTAKHLLSVALGAAPGFAPATHDNRVGPVSALQDSYIEHYQLKHYEPLMMAPAYYMGQQPVYYSLNYPTSLEFSPRSRNLSRTIEDLREIQHILKRTLKEIQKSSLIHTKLSYLPQQVQFDFFHSKPDRFGEIRSTSQMALEDPALRLEQAAYGQRQFAHHGDFVRGCIRIAPYGFGLAQVVSHSHCQDKAA